MSTGERILKKGRIPTGSAAGGLTWGRFAAEGIVEFGAPVEFGTDTERQMTAFAGNTFAGVAVWDETRRLRDRDGSGNPVWLEKYYDGDSLAVRRKGPVVVEVGEAIVAGTDPVYVSTDGKFYKQAGDGRTLVSSAAWGSDSQSADSLLLAELILDLPG